jgi:hypothetical protein
MMCQIESKESNYCFKAMEFQTRESEFLFYDI